MPTLTSLLVGAHFRPPASRVLQSLPSGTGLSLHPEPENSYDPAALRVLCRTSSIPESEFEGLEMDLPASGSDLAGLLAQAEIWLGYVASSGGTPLQKAIERGMQDLVGNQEFQALLLDPEHRASLAFAPDGAPLVILQVGVQT